MSPKTTLLLLQVEEPRLGQVCVHLQDLLEQLLAICLFVKLAEHLILIREVKPHSFLLILPPRMGCINLYTDISRLFIHSLVSPHLRIRTYHFGVASHHQGIDKIIVSYHHFVFLVHL